MNPHYDSNFVILSGNSNPALASEIAGNLRTVVSRSITSSADSEHFVSLFNYLKGGVQILDPVGDKHVYIIQSLSPPVNDNLCELLLLISAAKRAGSHKVTAVIPYCAYSREILPEEKHYLVPFVSSSVATLVKNNHIHSFSLMECVSIM